MASPFGDVPTRTVKTTDVKLSPFGDPASPNAEGSAMSKIAGGVMDVLRGAASGPRLALEGAAGMGGDIYDLGFQGADWLARKSLPPFIARHVQEEHAAAPDPTIPGWGKLPSSEQVRQEFTNPMFGEGYKPTTKAGEIAQTTTSMFTPSTSRANILRQVIAPTVGIEAGGEAGKAMGSETLGRLLGGFAGAGAPATASDVLTGGRLSPERERLVRTLTDAGVDLTAGQASGKKALQYLETGPFETKPAAIAGQQGEQFNRAALNEAGITGDRVTPETVQAARDNFGTEYDNLIAQTGGLPLDNDMVTDLVTLVDRYNDLKGAGRAGRVDTYLQRISDAARGNGNVIPTDVFASIRSDIAKDLRTLRGSDPTLEQTLRDFQDTLYGSIGRNAAPGIEGAWRDLNNRYRNFKTIEKSMLGAGADTAEGMITPSKLRTATQNADPQGYLAERGDLDQLARAGENVMKPLPQSGTTARASFPAMAATAGSALMSGHHLAAGGALIGGTLPSIASGVLTSRPVRTALVRNMTGQGPLPLDPMTAALLVRQAQNRGGQ